MMTAGVEPNVVTYTALISACVNGGDMDGARRLFGALEVRVKLLWDSRSCNDSILVVHAP